MKDEQKIIDKALQIVEDRCVTNDVVSSSEDMATLCRLWLGSENREKFGVVLLDSRHRVIEKRELFAGTVDKCNVYPREVIRAALLCNAVAMVLTHNHPSGNAEPSTTDKTLTYAIKDACKLMDIRLLDHIVVATGGHVSMAERDTI